MSLLTAFGAGVLLGWMVFSDYPQAYHHRINRAMSIWTQYDRVVAPPPSHHVIGLIEEHLNGLAKAFDDSPVLVALLLLGAILHCVTPLSRFMFNEH